MLGCLVLFSECRQQLLGQEPGRGGILASDEASVDDDVRLPVCCGRILGTLCPQGILKFVRNVFACVVVLFLLRERCELLALHERLAIAKVYPKERARTVTNGSYKLSSAPGAHDCILNDGVTLNVDHRSKTAWHEDGFVIGSIHFS